MSALTRPPIERVPSPEIAFTIPSVVVFNAVAFAAVVDVVAFPFKAPIKVLATNL